MNEAIYFEEWKYITDRSVPNIKENAYLISNLGRVYSNLRNKYLTPVMTNNGYFRVALSTKNNQNRYYLIHRIVMIEFCLLENYNEFQVNHIYGDKSINTISSLEWVTASENILHAFKNNLKTACKGEECSYATITNKQAEEIAQLLLTQKYTHQQISDITGVKKHIILNISNGSTWKDVHYKYGLDKIKKEFVLRLSDEELELLCQYFDIHKHEYIINNDLFRAALKDLFNIEYTNNMSATLSRIYNQKTRTEITNKYNF